jgi:hypothetical protein
MSPKVKDMFARLEQLGLLPEQFANPRKLRRWRNRLQKKTQQEVVGTPVPRKHNRDEIEKVSAKLLTDLRQEVQLTHNQAVGGPNTVAFVQSMISQVTDIEDVGKLAEVCFAAGIIVGSRLKQP